MRRAERGVLDAGRLGREVAAQGERAVEVAVEVQAPGIGGRVVDGRGVVPGCADGMAVTPLTGWLPPLIVSSKSATSTPVVASMPRNSSC